MIQIYKTTNLITNKIYIGLDTKCDPSYLGSGKVFKLSLKKHGRSNFVKEILFESNTLTLLEMQNVEVFFINKFNACDRNIGYNIRNTVVYNNVGMTFSEEHLNALRGHIPWNKGVSPSDETRAKISKSLTGKTKGRTKSEETRKKISDAKTGVPLSEYARSRMRRNDNEHNPMYGRTQSDESKRKNSEAHKGKPSGIKGKIAMNSTTEKRTIYIKPEDLDLYIKLGWVRGCYKNQI